MQKASLLGSDGSPLDALPHLGRCSITYLNDMCGTFLLMAVWFTAFPKNSTARLQMIPQVQLEVPVGGSSWRFQCSQSNYHLSRTLHAELSGAILICLRMLHLNSTFITLACLQAPGSALMIVMTFW